jgi:hypothetical protein
VRRVDEVLDRNLDFRTAEWQSLENPFWSEMVMPVLPQPGEINRERLAEGLEELDSVVSIHPEILHQAGTES